VLQHVTQHEFQVGYEHGGCSRLQMTLKSVQRVVSPLGVFTATVVGRTICELARYPAKQLLSG